MTLFSNAIRRVRERTVATSQQPSQDETDAHNSPHVDISVSPLKTEVPSPPAVTNADIQHTLQKINAKDYSFAGIIRSLRDPNLARESEPLLQAGVDDILAILRKEGRKRAWRTQLGRGVSLTLFLAWLVFAISRHSLSLETLSFLYIPFVLLGISTMASRKQQTAALALSRFDDIRAIGPLAEALEFQERDIRPIARRALIRLLPRLQASDAPLLSPAHRAILNRALGYGSAALILAILKAWEQVGDADAIPEVQNLAEGHGEGGQISEVVRAAKECLAVLRESVDRQQTSSQLLRPADANLTPTDILLRPATPHASTESPEQLLRPMEKRL
jgi:hypothetical protein